MSRRCSAIRSARRQPVWPMYRETHRTGDDINDIDMGACERIGDVEGLVMSSSQKGGVRGIRASAAMREENWYGGRRG